MSEVTFSASDGWRLSGHHRRVEGATATAVLVHASHHEQDAFIYGLSLPEVLAERGIASLRFDIRGRGTSHGDRSYREMGALERRAVALDIAAAIEHVGHRVAVIGEQDTAAAVVSAVAAAPSVAALVLMSPRLGAGAIESLQERAVPTYALVSKEDTIALRAAAHAYLAGPAPASKLDVFTGLGFGTTMFAARAFEQPGEPSLETLIATWLAATLIP